jgi:RNA polymerase sigma-70 factor (ECF subfamily)
LDNDLRAKVGPSDLVQETFLRAKDHWRDFTGGSEEELLAWLRHILLNQVHDARRDFDTQKRQVDREVTESPSHLEDPAASPSAQAIAAEQQAALNEALAQLPEDYRHVIVLRNWERRSFKEIGADLGRSAEAARKLWARAIEKLQQLLEKPADLQE